MRNDIKEPTPLRWTAQEYYLLCEAEWFQGRLLSDSEQAFDFAKKLLPKVHNLKELGPGFFVGLLQKADPEEGEKTYRVVEYAAAELANTAFAVWSVTTRPFSSSTTRSCCTRFGPERETAGG